MNGHEVIVQTAATPNAAAGDEAQQKRQGPTSPYVWPNGKRAFSEAAITQWRRLMFGDLASAAGSVLGRHQRHNQLRRDLIEEVDLDVGPLAITDEEWDKQAALFQEAKKRLRSKHLQANCL